MISIQAPAFLKRCASHLCACNESNSRNDLSSNFENFICPSEDIQMYKFILFQIYLDQTLLQNILSICQYVFLVLK